jgi:hypothetical protein
MVGAAAPLRCIPRPWATSLGQPGKPLRRPFPLSKMAVVHAGVNRLLPIIINPRQDENILGGFVYHSSPRQQPLFSARQRGIFVPTDGPADRMNERTQNEAILGTYECVFLRNIQVTDYECRKMN